MRKVEYFKLSCLGGFDGRTNEEQLFESQELAIATARGNEWNTDYRLYKVVLIFNEIIRTEETFIGEIRTPQDDLSIARAEATIERMIATIEKEKANTRIKEATRANRIAECEDTIAREQRWIDRLSNKM